MEQLSHALLGAFMGAIVSVLLLAWILDAYGHLNLLFIGIILCSVIGSGLSAVFGKRLIIFIRDYLLWPWG